MNHVIRRQFPTWERSSQIAFILGVILLVVMLGAVIALPQADRAFALAATGGVIIALQVVVMWANRGMVTPYAQAQKYYLAEAYEEAREILEAQRETQANDLNTLTLLGNTYRQLGRYDQSVETLKAALEIAPNHHFPLYGLGRTLLIEGDYQSAAALFEQALEAGAPSPFRVDLADAYYRLGEAAKAQALLETLYQQRNTLQDDPPRLLWVDYLRYQLDLGEAPSQRIIVTGLPYWQKTAAQFMPTPYATALMQDVYTLQQLVKGGQ